LQRGNCAPLPQRVVGCYTISNIVDVISTSSLTIEQGYVLAVLGATLGLFIWGKWQYDIVFVLALHAVAVPGIIDVCQAFAGFS